MTNPILSIKRLNKEYGAFKVLNDLNISIEENSIFGLIGENGAGKTTLLKIITGLSKQTSGELSIMGNDEESGLRISRKKIGCIIESPALYPNMSIEDNLRIQQLQKSGYEDDSEISDILNLINLQNIRKKHIWKLSYGMKQRLAIGIALIQRPTFLILDEPVNGLDPLGIKDLRNLLKKLNELAGTTILLSSHILSELEQIITDYGILHKGVLIEQGNVQSLNNKKSQYIKIISPDADKLENLLISDNRNYSRAMNNFKLYDKDIKVSILCNELVNKKINIEEIGTVYESLEDYFMRIIQEDKNEEFNKSRIL